MSVNFYYAKSKKIAFEINGNQHYDLEGKLKEYYQERHNYFKERGWILIEIPYLLWHQHQIKYVALIAVLILVVL